MRLPCVLSFTNEWGKAFTGVTANMHRNGLLISCVTSNLPGELPPIGSSCVVQVELPVNHTFTRKCVVCETVLIRVDACSDTETRLAMRIESVLFRDFDAADVSLGGLYNFSSSLIV